MRLATITKPDDNFIVDQPGRYTVDLLVTYDGNTSAGQVTAPFPQGHVLGTARGRFSVYARLALTVPPLTVDLTRARLPDSTGGLYGHGHHVQWANPAPSGHMTALIPGVVLEDGSLTGRGQRA